MSDPFRYVAQFQSARGGWTALPGWARTVVTLFALPGLILAALSIAALCVSLLALLLLTVPAYRFVQALTGTRTDAASIDPVINPTFADLFAGPSAGRRRVDVRVVDRERPQADQTDQTEQTESPDRTD
jgi:hypothetical protein